MQELFRGMGERSGIELAAGMRLGSCGQCSLPHLFLLDENGDAFAEVVMDADIMRELRDALIQMLGYRETKQ